MTRAIDATVEYDGRSREYVLRGRSQREASQPIRFCPWCGSLLFRTRVKREVAPPPREQNKRVAKRKRPRP